MSLLAAPRAAVGRSPAAAPAWTVVLPLKGGPAAKSRLGGPPGLAASIAADCLHAALACHEVARVVVVTADPVTAGRARKAGAEVVDERAPGAGLLAALRDALAVAPARWPCAVLLGDLPALRPVDLAVALDAADSALASCGAPAAFVPDAEGSGTVLLAGNAPSRLRPAFGPTSARAHAATGAQRLDLDLPRLRRDVDLPADLVQARRLGLGRATLAALRAHPDAAWAGTGP